MYHFFPSSFQLFSESKDEVALILFGTPTTANELDDDDDNYPNLVTIINPYNTKL
jgi:hypothetical protein